MLLGIQVARGVGALFVVLYHASIWSGVYYHSVLNGFFNFGYIGVDFFFVLSGFIIFYIHRNDSTDFSTWKRYFIKRIIRIYPPFIPISIVLLFVFLYYPNIGRGGKEISILSSIFLIPSWKEPSLEVSWTLMHEMLYYLFFSLYFFWRKYFSIISAIWVVLIVAYIGFQESHYLISFFLNIHNLEFFLGMIVAVAVTRYSKFYKQFFVAGNVMFLLFILALYIDFPTPFLADSKIGIVYLGIAFSFIVYGIYGFDKNFTIKYPKVLLLIGSASYSIYLIHYPFVSIFNRMVPYIYPDIFGHHHLIFLIIVCLCTGIGCLYHLLYEKKILALLRKTFIS